MRAAELLEQGLSQAEDARRVRVSRESVRLWWNQIHANGSKRALRKAGRLGRKPRLDETHLKRLRVILQAGPARGGFSSGPWTLARITAVIHRKFQVRYHPRHISWILRKRLNQRAA